MTSANSRAQTGHRAEAIAGLYSRFAGEVAAVIRRRVSCPELVDDLTADTFLRALTSDFDVTARRPRARGWLLTTAANLTTDHLRRAAAYERALGKIDHGPPEQTHQPRSIYRGLQPLHREVIYRRHLLQQTSPEIASATGLTERQIARHLALAEKAVRARIAVAPKMA